MVNDFKRSKPVILIGLTIFFLILLSYIPEGVEIMGYKIKPVELFIDIKPDSLFSQNSKTQKNNLINYNFVPEVYTASLSNNLMDKFLEEMNGDENSAKSSKENSNAEFNSRLQSAAPLSGNVSQLSYFYDAIRNARSQQIRIAHYGDSEIEGDLITANIREELQKKYSGMGQGYLAITSQDISFRMTTKHTFSSDWKTYSVLTGNPERAPLGINGFVSIPRNGSWVRYQTLGRNSLDYFTTVRVFYTDAKSSSINYQFDDGQIQSASLSPGSSVNQLILKAPGKAKSIKIIATQNEQAKFFGVSLEDGNGVYVDNFPLRGNSGVSLREIPESVLRQFNSILNYKLIILSFGKNMVNSGETNFSWYENQMVKVVNSLKSVFPQTSILIVGVGDKSVKRGSRFVTDPSIPHLLEAQKNVAQKTGVAFWNLFESMGGENSMDRWVKQNLAFRDYTHTNLQGSKKVAEMLVSSLLRSY